MDNSTTATLIGRACADALMAEVSATPKPGLVDRDNSGAHRDMDYSTFMDSIDAIAPAFPIFARVGMELSTPDGLSLSRIRPAGVRCEQVMFDATKGVNTHKGAIFSLGIIAAAAGYCFAVRHDMTADTICEVAAVIAGSAQADFEAPLPPGEPMTKGRELYARYGMRGIRGEAADGFPSVRALLPELRRLMREGEHSVNDIHLQILLGLMASVDDTNVAARCGMEAVERLHTAAKRVLAAGGALTDRGLLLLRELDSTFIEQNISPGGCADLLSVAVTLHSMEQIEHRTEENRHGGQ